MRANVFTDGSLARFAGQFAWLALDTEKAKNAAAKAKFPVEALPSFFVVDPATEKVVMRWVGGASVAQMAKMLDEALRLEGGAKTGNAGDSGAAAAADRALARADALYGEGKNVEAAAAYEEALAIAPVGWSAWGRATESLLFALDRVGDPVRLARRAKEAWPRMRKSPSAASVAASGLGAALSLPADAPDRGEIEAFFEAACREVVTDRSLPIAGDDRSGVWLVLVEARKRAGDDEGKRREARAWAAFLEAEQEAAASADQRAVYDSHLLSAWIAAGEPLRAVPALRRAESDFPDDYNPPARIAAACEAAGRWDEGLEAVERALARVYGPRMLNVLEMKSRLLLGKGNRPGAVAVLDEAIRLADSLPPGQRSEGRIEALKARREKVATEGAPSSAAPVPGSSAAAPR